MVGLPSVLQSCCANARPNQNSIDLDFSFQVAFHFTCCDLIVQHLTSVPVSLTELVRYATKYDQELELTRLEDVEDMGDRIVGVD